MELYEIDPLKDHRWADLVERRGVSSMFHTPGWLEALRRTYGFGPVAFTDSPPGESLTNGLVFCRVASWMTGRRLVSLPFSDHCEPLTQSPEGLSGMLTSIKGLLVREGRYTELRPLIAIPATDGFDTTSLYCLHSIDLSAPLSTIFARFHRSHTQRAIRKGERSGLVVEVGRSAGILSEFYALLALTRQRHGMPVQPFNWFQNLADCLGESVRVYLARHHGRPVAGIVTVAHKSTLVFKYGGSNSAYNRYGGMSLLLWQAIQDAKARGLVEFDLGRSDLSNAGLIAFKDHLGARRLTLTYYRYKGRPTSARRERWKPSVAKVVYSFLPQMVQARVGSGLYRHFA
jgi:GNAT acetyltransferase-like protein